MPRFILMLVLGCACLQLGAADSRENLASGDLFRLTNIWTVHLKVSPDAWQRMEPKGGGFMGGPPFGRGGGPGGGRPGGFGVSMFLAPAFLRDGDADGDAQLSKSEFGKLGEAWFAKWDKAQAGRINVNQLREGLSETLTPAGAGGFRMNLQGPEGGRNGVAAAAGIEFEYVPADLEFDGRRLTNIALRYKGNGTFLASRGSEKRSFKLDLNDYVKGQKLAGLDKINLHNNVTDASWMNEVLSHRLFRDAGVPAPRTAYAKVFVTVPGKYDKKYFGLYSLVENVDEEFAQHHFGTKKGAIFKPVTPDLFAYLGEDWARYNQTYDPKGNVSAEQKQRIIELCKLVSRASDPDFHARIGEFIDLEALARYMAVLVFLADLDGILGPGQNFYVHLEPKTQKLAFIPWDLDHSFGQFWMRGTQEQRENLSIHRPWQGQNRFLERIFEHSPFKQLYLERLHQFSTSIFRPERFHQQVDELAAAIRSAIAEESSDKLARFDAAVAGKPLERGGFMRGPGGPDISAPGKPIKPFATIRAQSIADQLAGRSEGQTLAEFGSPRPGGGPGRGFGPGMFLAGTFMPALDANKDGFISKEETRTAFARWFDAWDSDRSGILTEEQLRTGIDKDLAPQFGGPEMRPFPGPGR